MTNVIRIVETIDDDLTGLRANEGVAAIQTASDPSTDPSTLRQLSTALDADLRKAVASNPNTPLPELLTLAEEFPRQFLMNPVLPFLLLEDPRLPTKLSRSAKLSLVRLEGLPELFLQQWATERQDNELLRLVQRHVQIAGEAPPDWDKDIATLIAELQFSNDYLSTISPYLLAFPDLAPEWVIAAVAVHAHKEIRRQLANHIDIPLPAIALLVKDRSIPVRSALARSPQLPSHFLDMLAAGRSPTLHELVAGNPNTPASTLTRLAGSKGIAIHIALASNPSTPGEALSKIVQHLVRAHASELAGIPNAYALQSMSYRIGMLRCKVASHPNTPVDLLSQFSNDPESSVRKAAASHPHMPASLLEQLAHDSAEEVRMMAACHPQTPPAIVARFATDPSASIRMHAAANPQVPENLLRQLAQDAEEDVRCGIAWNTQAPADLLAALTTVALPAARRQLAQHPHTPATALAILAKDKDAQVRRHVAANPQTPPDILAKLAHVRVNQVLEGLLQNKNLTLDLIEQMLPRAGVTLLPAILRHPLVTPAFRQSYYATFLKHYFRENQHKRPDMLLALVAPSLLVPVPAEYATSSHWLCRFASARNPYTAEAVLEDLAHDGHQLIRAAARQTLALLREGPH